jgi:hypothetical protein
VGGRRELLGLDDMGNRMMAIKQAAKELLPR